jgi:ribulose-5-phosphate 4-epimerase/fuculose-1-phosphate aldolase
MIPNTDPSLSRAPRDMDTAEWQARVQLAAAYRLTARLGMDDLIWTHISARVPGRHDQFLMNPNGWLFDEITASSLVKVDVEGRPVDDERFKVNAAGFTIHSALHRARPDVDCVVHTHTAPGMAIAALECGLLPLNQVGMRFYRRVGYHDYEGVSLDLSERERIVQSIGEHKHLILRNHGLITTGRSVAEAFVRMYLLNRACEVQLATQGAGQPIVLPSHETCEHAARQQEGHMERTEYLDRIWTALLRLADRDGTDYRM